MQTIRESHPPAYVDSSSSSCGHGPRESLPMKAPVLASVSCSRRVSARLVLAASLALGGLLSTALLPGPALAAAPQLKTQAPGWYRLMVGQAEVTSLSDGTVALPVDQLLHAPAGRVAQGLKQSFQKAPLETSVNAWLINSGGRRGPVPAAAAAPF